MRVKSKGRRMQTESTKLRERREMTTREEGRRGDERGVKGEENDMDARVEKVGVGFRVERQGKREQTVTIEYE